METDSDSSYLAGRSGVAMSGSVAIKPCPFCGAQPLIRQVSGDEDRVWLQCDGCSAEIGIFSRDEAITVWNRRAPVPQTDFAPIEAIGSILVECMDRAVANGANSVSMPDEYVAVAAWLAGLPQEVSENAKDAAMATGAPHAE